jgi:hypothetical protein
MTPEQLANNPFFILELPTSATRMEVERAGQKLLAQLAIQVASVKSYRTPFGVAVRDEDKVRVALAALRNPEERALHELWASDDMRSVSEALAPPLPEWPTAMRSIGWRGPCTRS